MNIADIAASEYVEVDADDRLAKIRSLFERENLKGVVVTEDDEYARRSMRPGHERQPHPRDALPSGATTHTHSIHGTCNRRLAHEHR